MTSPRPERPPKEPSSPATRKRPNASRRNAEKDAALKAKPSDAGSGPESPKAPPVGNASSPNLASALPKLCPTCGARYPADFKVCPRDAVPLTDAPEDSDPILGQTLGDSYEVVRMIGEGGMGRVYEARHTRLSNKRYAIKMLHQELARQPEVVGRFQREAEAASALVHPNVVAVFDVNNTADGVPYIVGELLEGEQLGDYLDRVEQLEIAAAVRIVRHVCRALEAAHQRGIVHRDVKPENVFLAGEAATVKVLDFGISKVSDTQSNLTKTGIVMGTPDYMAPEQARGNPVDGRADVYAVGAILYRALTGKKPFEGLDDPMATLSAVLAREPPRPSDLEPSIPPALELVVQKAMAKEPSERYQTMAELEADLAPFDPGALTDSAERGSRISVLPGPFGPAIELSKPAGARAQALTARRVATAQSLAERTRAAELSRPVIFAITLLGLLLSIAGLIDFAAGAIRLFGEEATDLTAPEATLAVIGACAAMATPTVLWVRYLRQQVWPSTPRAIVIARRLRLSVLLGAAAYGIGALSVQVLEVVVLRQASGLAKPIYGVVLFLLALAVGVVVWVLTRARRQGS